MITENEVGALGILMCDLSALSIFVATLLKQIVIKGNNAWNIIYYVFTYYPVHSATGWSIFGTKE